jgi:sulfur carrier protein ThiS
MKPTDLRGILQYIPQFRDKTFVLVVDGTIVPDENFANFLPKAPQENKRCLEALKAALGRS